MKPLIYLIIIYLCIWSYNALAQPIPTVLDWPASNNGDPVLGYKFDVWALAGEGAGTMPVVDNYMFYNRDYVFCITPVFYGWEEQVFPASCHRIDAYNP